MRDVRVVGPISKASAGAVQQVNRIQFLSRYRVQRQHDAVLHVAIEGRAMECDVAQDHVWSQAGMVWLLRFVFLFATRRQKQNNNKGEKREAGEATTMIDGPHGGCDHR